MFCFDQNILPNLFVVHSCPHHQTRLSSPAMRKTAAAIRAANHLCNYIIIVFNDKINAEGTNKQTDLQFHHSSLSVCVSAGCSNATWIRSDGAKV